MDGDPQIITFVISSDSWTTDLIVLAVSFGMKDGTPAMLYPVEIRSRKSKISRPYFLLNK